MRLVILESKKIEHRTWYLCKCDLLEYLRNLKPDFYEYAIQRKIVKNQYLDKLYTTVKIGDPIPTLTLTYNKSTLDNIKDKNAELDLNQTEILDGLQRTFRLWAYLTVNDIFKKYSGLNFREFAKKIKDENSLFFDSGVISTKLIRQLIESHEITRIEECFSGFDIYLTIWTGLTENEVIRKMLVLNAGQKSVSKTHQFELLFLHFFDYIKEARSPVILYREKDPIANDIKKGKRETGHFMFSSIIVSLQSFVEGKPMRVSTEKLVDHEFDEGSETTELIYDLVFSQQFLIYYLNILNELDQIIDKKDLYGKEWFSKDTTISGVFAAIGKNTNLQEITNQENLQKRTKETVQNLIKGIERHGLHIELFNQEYRTFLSSSVNIGNFIRKVVMEYCTNLIDDGTPNWKEIFINVRNK